MEILEGHIFPEMLYPNVEELRQNYLEITAQADFKSEFDQLLRDYVGRPTPLYYASRLIGKIQHQNLLQTRGSLSYWSAQNQQYHWANLIGQAIG